jgi:hypothetical protein
MKEISNVNLAPFDPANRDHVARQLVLTASFAQHILVVSDRPDQSLGPESTQTLFAVLSVLAAYCAELQRILDDGEATASYGTSMEQAAHDASALISRMLEQNPTLELYSPNEAPKSLQEVILNYLAHALTLFSKHAPALASVN